MKLKNNKQINLQDYLFHELQVIGTNHGFKIDFDHLKKSKLEYLNKIKPVKYKTPFTQKHDYDWLLKLCCLSFSMNYRFVATNKPKLPDLWVWEYNNLDLQGVCLSDLSEIELSKLHGLLVQEHINIEILRERSINDQLIVDFFRMEQKHKYSNRLLTEIK